MRPLPEGQYEIVAGERRWRAAQLAGLTQVECLLSSYTDTEALRVAVIENVSRCSLNPLEEAAAYQRLIEQCGYSHEEIAASVGKSRVAITNLLRLLKLDQKVRHLITQGQLSEGQARLLITLDRQSQLALAQQAVHQGWTVRQMERAVQNQHKRCVTMTTRCPAPGADQLLHQRQLEMALSEHLGTQVTLDFNGQGGYLHIRFHSVAELEGHLLRLGFQNENE